MNEFTKEELIIIKLSIQDTIVKNDPWENPCLLSMHRTVKKKIQFMIDNYCEHKNKCTNGEILVCDDCGKEWK